MLLLIMYLTINLSFIEKYNVYIHIFFLANVNVSGDIVQKFNDPIKNACFLQSSISGKPLRYRIPLTLKKSYKR